MTLRRRRVVILLDIAAGLLLLLVSIVLLTDGFVIRTTVIRLSVRDVDRPLSALLATLILRLVLDRRTGPLGLSAGQWRALLLAPGADPFTRPASGLARRTGVAALALAAVLAVMMHEQWRHPYSVPDLEDPLFSIWRLAWVPHKLATDPARLFDGNIFHPDRLTLTLSDSMILPALGAAPLLAAGVRPVVAYNVLFLSAFWLSGMAMYLLVEHLTGSGRASFISALLFACAAFRFEHYSHLELQMTLWMPLALLALHLFVISQRWRHALLLAVAIVAQLYSSMYYAVFLLLYLTAIGTGLWFTYRPPVTKILVPLAASGVLAVLFAIPLARAYGAGESARWGRPLASVREFSAEPSDYLRTHPRSAMWTPLLPTGDAERQLFPGAAPVVLGAAGLVPPVSAVRWTYATALLVSFDASLGLNGWLYPFLHRFVPVLRMLRVTARFSVAVGMTLAILAGFGVRRMLRRRGPAAGSLVFGLLVAGVIADAWPVIRLTPVWKEPPPIYESLSHQERVVLFELPVTRGNANYFAENTPFMYFSLWHWRPMVNGYSGFIPESYGKLTNALERFPAPETIDALRRRGVTHITVNEALFTAVEGGDRLTLEGEVPGLRKVSDSRWLGMPIRVYEIER